MVPQGDTNIKINHQNKMAIKVTKKGQICNGTISHKINVTRSTFYMESFMLFKPGVHLVS